MNIFLKVIFSGVFTLVAVCASPVFAQNSVPEAPCGQLGLPCGTEDGKGDAKITLRQTIVKAINFVLAFVGVIAVAVVIYGGLKYVLSGGDESKASEGKKVILYAIIGIIIISLSGLIVNVILGGLQQQ